MEEENQLLHRKTVNLTKMMIINIMIRTMLKYTLRLGLWWKTQQTDDDQLNNSFFYESVDWRRERLHVEVEPSRRKSNWSSLYVYYSCRCICVFVLVYLYLYLQTWTPGCGGDAIKKKVERSQLFNVYKHPKVDFWIVRNVNVLSQHQYCESITFSLVFQIPVSDIIL